MSNSFGNILKLTTFGESHGKMIGGVLDGFPAGVAIDETILMEEMARRKPGQSDLTTSRHEDDKVDILSGVFDGYSTGCPIAFVIPNKEHRSEDYGEMKDVYRPSHADYTYQMKYGIRDYRGGGRSSARETAVRVAAGAFAKMALRQLNISIGAFISRVGEVALQSSYQSYDLSLCKEHMVYCPDARVAEEMAQLILKTKERGDTIGGIISCVIKGCPAGLGAPVYAKLHAALGSAMLSINAVKGFEYGEGFEGVRLNGSQQNDFFRIKNGEVRTVTNHSGGIQGGISNGEDIYFNVAFKPVATLFHEQLTVDVAGNERCLKAKGRHDACVLPRAVPIVEAMAALTILDHYLLNKTIHL